MLLYLHKKLVMITISTQIDLNKITKEEAKALFVEILKSRKIDKAFLQEIVNKYSGIVEEDSEEDMLMIEKMVDKHFDEYDEVFKALA